MKITDNKIIVFLDKKFDVTKMNLEKYFKKLFNKIKINYGIDVSGYYNIDVYVDNYYGNIIEINKEDNEYYNFFNQIDMRIKINKGIFLYEIDYEYLNNKIINNCILYKLNNRLYLQIKNDIVNNILEYSNIIYGKEVRKILKYSEKVIL